MTISTYNELQTAVASWLHRSDLASQIPDFISLAERRIFRLIQGRLVEDEIPLAMTIGSRFIQLPDDFVTAYDVWIETYPPRYKLTPVVPQVIPVTDNVSGIPQYWCVDGENLAFNRPADQPYALTLRYERNFTLSDTNATNDLLTASPDLYLYGALIEAAPYIRDNAQLSVWQDRFDRAITETNNNENSNRSVAVLTTDVMLRTGRRFNIYRGY